MEDDVTVMQARPIARRPKARRARKRPMPAAVILTLFALAVPQLTLAPAIAGGPGADVAGSTDQADRGAPWVLRSLDEDGPVPLHATRVVRPISAVATADETQAGRFQAALDAARESALSYGVTFAVVRGGRLLWSGGSGTTSDQRATALDGDTPLVIGSITKTFVAATVLQLVDEGRLRLTDSVHRFLPDAPISDAVTVRQLLDHTSGLADVFNDTTAHAIETQPERVWSAEELLAGLHAPWYEPGQAYAYANTNYLLLGLLIERITHESLADELDQRFLGPLRLHDTRVLTPTDGDAGPLAPAWTTIFWSSGAMTSSAVDLARWGEALYHGNVVSSASRTAMTHFNAEDYGLGAQRIPMPGGIGIGHTGLLHTYTSMLVRVPSQDVTIAILVNRGKSELAQMLTAEGPDGSSLLELAFGRTDPLAVPGPTTP